MPLAATLSEPAESRRWGRLFPPRDQSRQPVAVSTDWVQGRLKHAPWVARARQRLQSLRWFMKGLTRQGRKSEIRNSKSETNPKSKVQMAKGSVLPRRGPTSADRWQARLENRRHGRLLGRFFATSRARLREVAEQLGLRRVPNVAGYPTT